MAKTDHFDRYPSVKIANYFGCRLQEIWGIWAMGGADNKSSAS